MALGLRPEDVIVTIGTLNRVLISFIVSQAMQQYSVIMELFWRTGALENLFIQLRFSSEHHHSQLHQK